jgi:hypothetical protein
MASVLVLEDMVPPESGSERATRLTLADAFRSKAPAKAHGYEPPLSRLSGYQATCPQVLPLTAAQADTSLMPNSAASCR